MIPEQLKLSILQSAFQGKLTGECVPNETADDLYQQIQSEKQRLISEKKIKKEKPLPEISADEIPFDIPDNWRWCYVGDLFLHNTGKAQNSSGSTNGIIRKFITTSNLYWGEFDFTKVKEMPFTDTELERCTVKRGDLLVCEGGDCGRSAVWDYDEEVCIQNHVHRLRPYRDVNIYYFYYLFYLYKNTGRLRGRGVAIQGLSNEAIHKVVLPLAPLEEQHRIVAKIEELLPYVDRYATAYEKLEQFNAKFPNDMKKSILEYAIQGKLVEQRAEEGTGAELYKQMQAEKQRLIKEKKIKKEKTLVEITDDEIPFDIPETWIWIRVGDVGSWGSGATPPRTNPAYYGGSIPWLKTGDLNDGFIKEVPEFITELALEKTSVRLNPVGSVLMAMYGATIGKLGILEIPVTTNQACCACIPYAGMYNKYLFYYLMSMRQTYIGMAEGGAQPNISKEKIVNSILPLPPLEEQHRIVAKLEEILPLCERLK
mgnify:CR=1 FL=1